MAKEEQWMNHDEYLEWKKKRELHKQESKRLIEQEQKKKKKENAK